MLSPPHPPQVKPCMGSHHAYHLTARYAHNYDTCTRALPQLEPPLPSPSFLIPSALLHPPINTLHPCALLLHQFYCTAHSATTLLLHHTHLRQAARSGGAGRQQRGGPCPPQHPQASRRAAGPRPPRQRRPTGQQQRPASHAPKQRSPHPS